MDWTIIGGHDGFFGDIRVIYVFPGCESGAESGGTILENCPAEEISGAERSPVGGQIIVRSVTIPQIQVLNYYMKE